MEVIELILKQLSHLKKREVSGEELARSKTHLKGHITLGWENTFSRMVALATHEIYFGRRYGLDEILAGIDRVSIPEVNQLANELFDSRYLTLVALGNLDGKVLSPDILQC
jgi:predicted Zn-dependent peptidase